MSQPKPGLSDYQAEQLIGKLLRIGVLTAAAVVFLGGLVYLVQHSGEEGLAKLQEFKSEPAELRNILGIIQFTLAGHSRGLIQLGLVLLIATPVSRVILSVFLFGRQRDWAYVLITLFVLLVLLYSLFLERLTG
jgi:uncharacterized membrane protein